MSGVSYPPKLFRGICGRRKKRWNHLASDHLERQPFKDSMIEKGYIRNELQFEYYTKNYFSVWKELQQLCGDDGFQMGLGLGLGEI